MILSVKNEILNQQSLTSRGELTSTSMTHSRSLIPAQEAISHLLTWEKDLLPLASIPLPQTWSYISSDTINSMSARCASLTSVSHSPLPPTHITQALWTAAAQTSLPQTDSEPVTTVSKLALELNSVLHSTLTSRLKPSARVSAKDFDHSHVSISTQPSWPATFTTMGLSARTNSADL